MEKDDLLSAFGKKIQEARRDKRLSQESLADLAGLDRTYISSMERGKRNVSLLNIIKVANALSVPPETFIKGLGDINEES
ncbi:helix-turn-helix domain-containing protein [Photobacterium carnosum]|uniref:helix-turn-helix domain-containing protein n=1 Tax=Photobacterium carnosum TaxID=2023717 RepID=UPI001E2C268F|nr:helix-turn-helix transcriptional regulator [Photobacterium carnosum]MCD9530677.1 helix-turn-helix domain-containing protein [Photobacterium carnosum]MCF2155120.1 helix-turn-helix domain-containing protein [Photobacterium carnosum]MCF2216406.1 helix-turn-helix domain-containing protein [Photobacterium carnosum]